MLAEGGRKGDTEVWFDYHGFSFFKCSLLSQLVWRKTGC